MTTNMKSRKLENQRIQRSPNIDAGIPLYKLDPTAPENTKIIIAAQQETIQRLEQKRAEMQKTIADQQQKINTLESEAIIIDVSKQAFVCGFLENPATNLEFQSGSSLEPYSCMISARNLGGEDVRQINQNFVEGSKSFVNEFSALPIIQDDVSFYFDDKTLESRIDPVLNLNLPEATVSIVTNTPDWMMDSNVIEQNVESIIGSIYMDDANENLSGTGLDSLAGRDLSGDLM